MSDCSTCGSQQFCHSFMEGADEGMNPRSDEWLAPADGVEIGTIVAVTGAKGGVGTSMLVSALALKAVQAGLRVGILDADIGSPDIPVVFGATEGMSAPGDNFIPVTTKNDIKIMSYANFMTEPTEPMLWGNGMMAAIAEQFWTSVEWCKLDLLLIDLPAGGGDVTLTLGKIVPIDAVLLVTTVEPHTLVRAEQTRNLFDNLRVPVYGMIANVGATRGEPGDPQTAAVRMGLQDMVSIVEQSGLNQACQDQTLSDYDIANQLNAPWSMIDKIIEDTLDCARKTGSDMDETKVEEAET